MLQFVLTMVLLIVWGWIVTAAVESGVIATALCAVAMLVAAWILQTDAEKQATKKWWHDRL